MALGVAVHGVKPISRRQFAAFRILFGLYLGWHFAELLPWGAELWSNHGVFPDPAANLTYALFPNPLALWDAPWVVTAILSALTALSILYALGIARRTAAVGLWFGLACLFNRNNLIANPALPYVGVLLLLSTLVPLGEGMTPRRRPSQKWFFPASVFSVAWILMVAGYSYSGWVKLAAPSWLDGNALAHILDNPLARPTPLRDLLLACPLILLRLATWGGLGLELLAAPLALVRALRPWIWLGLLALHLGILALVDFADLTAGMIFLHVFTFDPEWFPPRPSRAGRHLVLYDGVCGLCDRSVQFLLEEDRGGVLTFAPLQGETARQALASPEITGSGETMILLRDFGTPEQCLLVRSTAALGILELIGGCWRPLSWLRLIPRSLRDAVYRWVARNRYRWFGRSDSCNLPPPDVRERFLD